MPNRSPAVDRAVRIELLRARAALERESLVHSIAAAGQALAPAALLRRYVPRLGAGNASRLLWQAVSLARRYPFISSTLSALIMGRGGKRSRLLRLVGGALLGWQVLKAWRTHAGRDAGHADGGRAGRTPRV